jgi:hypothetical protein
MQTFIQWATTFASILTIGFGIWHFFVPRIWNWYSYIDKEATELVLAVRAINYFFSLCLVLMGVINIILVWKDPWEIFSLIVVIAASAFLWLNRIILQLIFPQGSQSKALQYGMLTVFSVIFLSYLLIFCLLISN